MQCSIGQSELSRALSAAARAIPSRSGDSKLSQILLRCDHSENKATLTGTNMDSWIEAECSTIMCETGEVCLPGLSLSEYVSKLSNSEPVNITVDDGIATIRQGRSTHRFPVMDSKDFPLRPKTAGEPVSVNLGILMDALGATLFCTENVSGSIFGGLLIELDADKKILELSGCDKHRASSYRIKTEGTEEPLSHIRWRFVVPGKEMERAKQALSGAVNSNSCVQIVLCPVGKSVLFRAAGISILLPMLDGIYPDLSVFWDKQDEVAFSANRKQLASALGRLQITSKDSGNRSKWIFGPQSLAISAASPSGSQSYEAVETVSSGAQGEAQGEIEMGINPGYALQGIGAFDSDEVTFHVRADKRTVVLTSGDTAEVGLRHLVMPQAV